MTPTTATQVPGSSITPESPDIPASGMFTPAEKQALVEAELKEVKHRLRQQAEDHRGKKRAAVSRESLLQRLSAVSDQPLDHRRIAWNMILSEEYAPSLAPLQTLEKVMLDELLMDTHHQGKMLLLRTVSMPAMHSTIQDDYAVEDEQGDIERLTIHDFGISHHFHKAMPIGICFAIKEPFFKTIVDDGCVLCVDHPSDVVFLDSDHEIIPRAWKLVRAQQTALDWKVEGNETLKHKQYLDSERCYTKALQRVGTSNETLKRDLHRNRAQARLYLERYDGAYTDALASLSKDRHDPVLRAQDAKAFFRAGRAAYQLGAFGKALEAFTSMVDISHCDDDGLRELERTKGRIAEQETGIYHWQTVLKREGLADHADFTRRTEIRQTKGRGRGLFAAESIPCGEITLCEKAFSLVPSPTAPTSFNLVIPPAAIRGVFGCSNTLWTAVTEKVLANPSIGTKLVNLYGGPNHGPLESHQVPILDGTPVVDVFRLENTIDHNSFEYFYNPRLTSFSNAASTSPRADLDGSMGLWVHAAYTNHSCLFNADYSFIGDMIIFRSTRDIRRGEEILTRYTAGKADFDKRDAALKTWGFRCDCKLCHADIFCAETERRKHLLEEIDDLLQQHPIMMAVSEPAETVDKFEDLLSRLEQTYSESLYNDLPKLGLVKLHRYLAFAYSGTDPEKAIQHAFGVLSARGYKLTITGQDLEVDRRNAIPAPQVVDQLMNIRKRTMRTKAELAQKIKELALQTYIIINGEPSGFESRYGLT